jgi:lipopolysaccharide transport system permease protein
LQAGVLNGVANPNNGGLESFTTTYTADAGIGLGPAVWRTMARRTWESRELIWRLILRDFRIRYRQSLLGPTWAVISVLLPTAIFFWLNRAQVLPMAPTRLPYPLFLLLNLTVWQLFASGIASATLSLTTASSLVTKMSFPLEALVLAGVAQSVLDFLIRVVVLVAAFLVVGPLPPWASALITPLLLPLLFLTIGIGFLASLLNALMRDLGQILTLLLTFMMFLSPVLYPIDASHTWAGLLNPVTPFLQMAQDLSTTGHLSSPTHYLVASAFAIVFFLVAWRLFIATSVRIAERI